MSGGRAVSPAGSGALRTFFPAEAGQVLGRVPGEDFALGVGIRRRIAMLIQG